MIYINKKDNSLLIGKKVNSYYKKTAMNTQSKKAEAQALVEKIIASNDVSGIKELTLNTDNKSKADVLASIKKLDMAPLSTDTVCS